MTIDEIIPAVGLLTHADKIRLPQAVPQPLAHAEAHDLEPAPRRCAGDNPLKGSVILEQDIVSPIGDAWDATQ